MEVRNAARALIQEGNRLLVTENYVESVGTFYLLPGGGLEAGKENLVQALERELQEEIGAVVSTSGLRFVREYTPSNHPFFADYVEDLHQFDFIFQCNVADDYDPSLAPPGDIPVQRSVRWMFLSELKSAQYYPKAMLNYLDDPYTPDEPVYLGDVG